MGVFDGLGDFLGGVGKLRQDILNPYKREETERLRGISEIQEIEAVGGMETMAGKELLAGRARRRGAPERIVQSILDYDASKPKIKSFMDVQDEFQDILTQQQAGVYPPETGDKFQTLLAAQYPNFFGEDFVPYVGSVPDTKTLGNKTQIIQDPTSPGDFIQVILGKDGEIVKNLGKPTKKMIDAMSDLEISALLSTIAGNANPLSKEIPLGDALYLKQTSLDMAKKFMEEGNKTNKGTQSAFQNISPTPTPTPIPAPIQPPTLGKTSEVPASIPRLDSKGWVLIQNSKTGKLQYLHPEDVETIEKGWVVVE